MSVFRYREAGAEVIAVLSRFSPCVERASIDEAYIDLTEIINNRLEDYTNLTAKKLENSFVIGWKKEPDGEQEVDNGQCLVNI